MRDKYVVIPEPAASGVPKALALFPAPRVESLPVPVFGRISDDVMVVYCTDACHASIGGWQRLGTVCVQDPRSDAALQAACIDIEFTDDYYAQLTSRTAPLTGGLLRGKCVGFVGTGASINLIESMARTGVDAFSLWDMDVVELGNVGRTAYDPADIGMSKVDAAARHILNINPEAAVHRYPGDFLIQNADVALQRFEACDLVVMGTDSQAVQLRGNAIGVAAQKPMVFPGFYDRAAGGEIVIVVPGGPCYRCQVRTRFEGGSRQESSGAEMPSEPGLVFDCDHLDSIVGKISTALLLRDCQNELGALREHVSRHSLIISKHSGDFLMEGEDLFGEFYGKSPVAYAYQTLWLDPSSWRDSSCDVCGVMSDS